MGMAINLYTTVAIAGATACLANTALSQEDATHKSSEALIPSCQFERALCGYVDENGETAIAPQFDWADRFFEGRARIRSEGLYGFIDESGEEVVPAVYDSVSTYWNGVAQVRKDGKTALLDSAGKVLVRAAYDFIVPLDDDHVLVSAAGNAREPRGLEFRPVTGLPKGDLAILNLRTGKKTEPVFAGARFLSESLGSPYWLEIDRKYYLTNTEGHRLSEGFDYGGTLFSDRAIVQRSGRYGAVNAEGAIVVPLRFDFISGYAWDKWARFREGPRQGGKVGYIDRDGNVMIEARFDQAGPFENDKAEVRIGENDFQIDRNGAIVGGNGGCQDGLTREKHDSGYRILGPNGHPINDETYSYVRLECGKPTIVCKSSRRCGYLRRDGTLVAGRYFWDVASFFDGVAGVQPAEDLFGIIDQDGDFILEPMQHKVQIFVTGNYRSGFFSGDGNVLIDRQVAEALAKDSSPLLWTPTGRARCRDDGVSIVEEGQSITFNDKWDRPFIKGQFDYAACFREGVAWVAIADRQQWCQITKKGTILTATCRCEQPLIAVEHFGPRPKEISCYSHGLEIVRDFDRRRKPQ
jgi:hypothetical protein